MMYRLHEDNGSWRILGTQDCPGSVNVNKKPLMQPVDLMNKGGR